MKLLSIEQVKEIDAIYCMALIKEFKELEFRKLVLGNFLLKYPMLLKKMIPSIEITENESSGIMVKEGLKYYDSWDKNTIDALRILTSKGLAAFKSSENDIVISTEKTSKGYKLIKEYPEFNHILYRAKDIVDLFNGKDFESIKGEING